MTDRPIALLRDTHQKQRAEAIAHYREQNHPESLLAQLSDICDRTLRELTAHCPLPCGAALVAAGGYGRGELYPYSDVDVLILLAAEPGADDVHAIQRLVAAMWDLGLEPSHSVRTIRQCLQLAERDVTTETALLEARWLAGDHQLVQRLLGAINDQLDPQAFFIAKCAEMERRHAHFHDTPYALEPNCKESPGALRDLQLLSWLAQAAGYGASWGAVMDAGALTATEYRSLRRAERAFMELRIELHLLAGRREDRVLFDLQPALARVYGFQATKTRSASELLMQRYYWAARVVTQLSTILIQSIRETLFHPSGQPLKLTDDFQIVHGRLDIQRSDCFARNPALILRAFLCMQQHPELTGMSARTVRAIWHARRRIDAQFRRNPVNQDLFLRILKQPHGVADALYRMTMLNILPRYLPAFRRIIGQMQHDLFHAYTVDEHTLKVIRNLRRFLLSDHAQEYPLASQLMHDFDQPWLIYVAALFHDIAKGRSGGHHARLGAIEARRFCRQHRISSEDTELIVFLVEHHLLMSTVAQKRDLSDPRVIHEFTTMVNSERRLHALYMLTVADIRATSPTVWNSWKGKLLEDLHQRTLIALGGLQPDTSTVLSQRKELAAHKIRLLGISEAQRDTLWGVLDAEYFLRHEPNEIAWHAEHIASRQHQSEPLVRARVIGHNEALQVLVYCVDREDLFASICHYFDRHTFSIQDARIHTTADGRALDSFIVLFGHETDYHDHIGTVQRELAAHLLDQNEHSRPPASRGRHAGAGRRQARTFPINPQLELQPADSNHVWRLSIVCADRPGLLYDLALLFSQHRINLKMAKIHTLGQRVEDSFIIEGQQLADAAVRDDFSHAILELLHNGEALWQASLTGPDS